VLSPALLALTFPSDLYGEPGFYNSGYYTFAPDAQHILLNPGLSVQVTVPGYQGNWSYESDPYKPGTWDLISTTAGWSDQYAANGPASGNGIEVVERYPFVFPPAQVPLPANGEVGIIMDNGAPLGPLYFCVPDNTVSSIWLLVLALTGMYGVSRFKAMRIT
jgi:hypothetical protein